MAVRNIKLVVEYDGAALSGWQRQANAPTVQGHLEDALAHMLNAPTKVAGASRTDAGVHARGQVAMFRTERTIPLHGFRRGLNAALPKSIAIREATEVPDDFHPRFSATGKHYRYSVYTRPDRSPFVHDRAWHYYKTPVDLERMRVAAAAMVGIHDFAAFRAADCDAKTTIREIRSLDLSIATPDLITVDLRGNAFLRNMVRIIVGTLVEAGAGHRDPTQVPEIIASRDRVQAGITAPPFGLELVEVFYEPGRRKPVSSDSSSR